MPGHVNLAIMLVEQGDYDGAIDAVRTALRLDPNNPEAHYQLGFALGAKNNLDGAITELREAVRLCAQRGPLVRIPPSPPFLPRTGFKTHFRPFEINDLAAPCRGFETAYIPFGRTRWPCISSPPG